MLDIKLLQKNIDYVIDKLRSRNVDEDLLKKLSKTINDRNKFIVQLNEKQEERNKISAELAKNRAEEVMRKASLIKRDVKELEDKVNSFQTKLDDILPYIPNIPQDNVPIGKDEEQNVEIIKKDKLGRGLVKNVKPHYEIAVEKGMVDFERGAKISGSRFAIFKNQGAKLIRALENFMLDVHIKNGYEEFLPPVLVNTNTMFGTGQLPKFKDDLFKVDNEDLWLIPTAEVPLTN